jgi:hypothetical protein
MLTTIVSLTPIDYFRQEVTMESRKTQWYQNKQDDHSDCQKRRRERSETSQCLPSTMKNDGCFSVLYIKNTKDRILSLMVLT